MSIDYSDVSEFNEGISEREAYIHSLYWVALSAIPGYGKGHADKLIGDIRRYADDLYPLEDK